MVNQVPALKKLLDARNQLRDLASKADSSDKLEALLEDILQNEDQLKALAQELRNRNTAGTEETNR